MHLVLKYVFPSVTELFSGQLRSSLHCSVCSHYSNTFDVFCDLSLPIPKVTLPGPVLTFWHSADDVSSVLFVCVLQKSDYGRTVTLRECLDLFSQEEKLDKENSPVSEKHGQFLLAFKMGIFADTHGCVCFLDV